MTTGRLITGDSLHAMRGMAGDTIDSVVTAPATDEAKQWDGWGTALKPAWEPILVCRKPLVGTVAANILAHGTGGLNIDACRVPTDENRSRPPGKGSDENYRLVNRTEPSESHPDGRWPANVIHDGSDEVMEAFAAFGEKKARAGRSGVRGGSAIFGQAGMGSPGKEGTWPADAGGTPARFFYCAKASKADRGDGNTHPTVKPSSLMRYLVRLVTPPEGAVLDPFAGSGSTGVACRLEGFGFVGVELSPEYADIARRRIMAAGPRLDPVDGVWI